MPDDTNDLGRRSGGFPTPELLAASLERISSDLGIVLRDQELNRSLIEEVRSQLTVIRQVIDYILFVSPEQAKDENDLYPFSNWLSGRLEKIIAVCEKREPASQAIPKQQLEVWARERASMADELGELGTGVRQALDQLNQQLQNGLASLLEGQDKLLSEAGGLSTSIAGIKNARPEERLAPYDDLDLQLAEIKELISKKTSRERVYENFFYGLVILMLFLNMALLLWVKISM